tara:strand:+ start:153 stop:365 length:213 start_codon:yes stop_codon:yes gene_type:complete
METLDKTNTRGVMMKGCDNCKVTPWVLLVAGLLWLGVDLGWGFASFWAPVHWWSVLFLGWGLKGVLKSWR